MYRARSNPSHETYEEREAIIEDIGKAIDEVNLGKIDHKHLSPFSAKNSSMRNTMQQGNNTGGFSNKVVVQRM